MVTIDKPGPFLDRITITVAGRKIALDQHSDPELLICAERELERTFKASEHRLSEKDKKLFNQARIKVYHYRLGYGG